MPRSLENAPAATPTANNAALASAHRTLDLEIAGLKALRDSLNEVFIKAVDRLHAAKGRVIVTGMGKSGHIAGKIAATLSSTGTPAQFVHPAEASHGDLGMITVDDVILALSKSGETTEFHPLIDYALRFEIPIIAITANEESTLAKAATHLLQLPNAQEACPNGLAPTTSTTLQLALGDALAVALLEKRGFTATDFKIFHPGGKLGAMLRQVGEIMHGESGLPLASRNLLMDQALILMTTRGFGCLGIVDEAGALIGIITDGDLRRHMGSDLLSRRTEEIMTRAPKVIPPTMLTAEALKIMNALRITGLFVVENGKPVGFVHIHDFLRMGAA